MAGDLTSTLNAILEEDPIQNVQKFEIKTNGMVVANGHATLDTEACCAPFYEEPTEGKKTWFALVTVNVKAAFPEGFHGVLSSTSYLGTLQIAICQDKQKQPLEDDAVEILQQGPLATSEGASISNSINWSFGANIGVFGEIPTAGATGNYSISKTISNTIPPIRITTHRDSNARKQTWDLDFTGVETSESSHSNFDATFQTLWRWRPAKGTRFYNKLEEMDFKLSVHWRPRVKWMLGGGEENFDFADDPGKAEYALSFGKIPQTKGENQY